MVSPTAKARRSQDVVVLTSPQDAVKRCRRVFNREKERNQ
jgi:hypothetical protein